MVLALPRSRDVAPGRSDRGRWALGGVAEQGLGEARRRRAREALRRRPAEHAHRAHPDLVDRHGADTRRRRLRLHAAADHRAPRRSGTNRPAVRPARNESTCPVRLPGRHRYGLQRGGVHRGYRAVVVPVVGDQHQEPADRAAAGVRRPVHAPPRRPGARALDLPRRRPAAATAAAVGCRALRLKRLATLGA